MGFDSALMKRMFAYYADFCRKTRREARFVLTYLRPLSMPDIFGVADATKRENQNWLIVRDNIVAWGPLPATASGW